MVAETEQELSRRDGIRLSMVVIQFDAEVGGEGALMLEGWRGDFKMLQQGV